MSGAASRLGVASSPSADRGRRARWWVGALLVAFGGVLGFQRWGSGPGDFPVDRRPRDAQADRGSHAMPGHAAGSDGDARPTGSPPAAATPSAGAGPVERLWSEGSLRGTLLDGDWGRWSADRLQPSFSLRQRFDQLLSARGEVEPNALRRWIAAQVAAAHGSAGAAQVLDIWDRYLQVQSAPYALEADPNSAATWQPALAEHSRVRRQLLGSAWSEAFYGAEERGLAADAARAQSNTPTHASAADPADALLTAPAVRGADGVDAARLQAARIAQFGAPAAERLQANDEAWAVWRQRIDAARAAWAAIGDDLALSAPQRVDAQERLLTEQFDAGERPRARGLIAATASARGEVPTEPR